MKNPIISELRRIRDENARRHNYDLAAMAREWVATEPWEKARTVTLRGGRIVPAFPVRKPTRKRVVKMKGNNPAR